MKKLTKELIVFENDQIIIVNKPSGILTQPDTKSKEDLLAIVSAYLGRPAYITHRIDRPASGLIIYAKSQKAANDISAHFRGKTIRKEYLVLIEKNGDLLPVGQLEHLLKKNGRNNKSYIDPAGKKAILQYEILHTLQNYFLVKVILKTGRHHQIRAQFAAEGFFIKGDNKYGAKRNNRDRSIHLHAWKIALPNLPTFIGSLPQEDPLWNVVQDLLK